MSSKRFALSFVAAIAVAIAAGFAASPHVAYGDWGNHGGKPPGGDDGSLASDSRVQQGFNIAPVPLNLNGKNRGMVGLGSYIVNAMGACNDCHTCPNFQPQDDPYRGGSGRPNAVNYLAGGRQFGPFTSANITPQVGTGLPAGMTLEQFVQFIRTGHDPHDGDLVQVMPWPIYRNMTDRDLEAVYAYLTAIPHAEPGVCAGP